MQLKGLSAKEEAKLRALQSKEALRMAQADHMVEQELRMVRDGDAAKGQTTTQEGEEEAEEEEGEEEDEDE